MSATEEVLVRPARREDMPVIRKLIQDLAEYEGVPDGPRLSADAVSLDVHRIDWHVLQGNEPAERFYARLGARDLRITENRAALRLDRPQIERVAAANDDNLPSSD